MDFQDFNEELGVDENIPTPSSSTQGSLGHSASTQQGLPQLSTLLCLIFSPLNNY